MGRDLSGAKCQSILTATKTLFWKYGVKRVSVKEICQEAGVSKMTFYRFFENKIDLAKVILDMIYDRSIQEYEEVMSMDIPFLEKVRKTLAMEFRHSQDMSEEFLMDIYKNKSLGLLDHLMIRGNDIREKILDSYEKAQKDGDVRADIKREFILYQINKIEEMMADKKLLAMYDTPQDAIMEVCNFFFYGLLERNNNKK